MSKIILEPTLRGHLNGLSHTLEFCDESGRTLGRFIPEAEYQHLILAAAEAACPYSAEELAASRQKTTGRPLAEILKQHGMS